MSDQNGVQLCKNLLALVKKNEKKIAQFNRLIETARFLILNLKLINSYN